jgi:site-specific recombinase XerD
VLSIHLHLEKTGVVLRAIRTSSIESYIAKAGKRLGRASLQHEIAALRGFLRFLSTDGRAPAGLDRHIDTPRLDRLEQLPRTLPPGKRSAHFYNPSTEHPLWAYATTRCFR